MDDCRECGEFARSNSDNPFGPPNRTVDDLAAWCTECKQGWVQFNLDFHLWFTVRNRHEMRTWIERTRKRWPLLKRRVRSGKLD